MCSSTLQLFCTAQDADLCCAFCSLYFAKGKNFNVDNLVNIAGKTLWYCVLTLQAFPLTCDCLLHSF